MMKPDQQFYVNIIRMNQFKADSIELKIEEYYDLWDQVLDLKHAIKDIRSNLGGDGLSHEERHAIHNLKGSIFDTLDQIDRMPDIEKLNDRLAHIEHRIEHQADMWNIDHW